MSKPRYSATTAELVRRLDIVLLCSDPERQADQFAEWIGDAVSPEDNTSPLFGEDVLKLAYVEIVRAG